MQSPCSQARTSGYGEYKGLAVLQRPPVLPNLLIASYSSLTVPQHRLVGI